MPRFSLESLAALIETHLPRHSGRFCVALSGGLDSAVLLRAFANLCAFRPGWSVRSVHVDHQLQSGSAEWGERCRAFAAALNVPCTVHRVQVIDEAGEGPEAAARRARYRALQDNLREGEVLATAHHADDQLETLLIALLRGSGVKGLASMPAVAPFGSGVHLRPLLDFTRQDLSAWARQQGIEHIEDPSNRNTRFDRNFLRHEVIPLLRSRWPAVALTVSRSARHMAEADALLEQLADGDLQRAAQGECLSVDELRQLTPPRRRLLLRRWIELRGLLLPATATLTALEHDMLQAADDRVPCVSWQGAAVHRHRDLLYAVATLSELDTRQRDWDWREPLSLGALGTLSLTSASRGLATARLPPVLQVSFRAGGERIHLAGEAHHRELKKLLHSSAILPWWREYVPLVYAGAQLAAVGDLWIGEAFAAKEGEPAMCIEWSRQPNIFAFESNE